jgi:hypothetical protein
MRIVHLRLDGIVKPPLRRSPSWGWYLLLSALNKKERNMRKDIRVASLALLMLLAGCAASSPPPLAFTFYDSCSNVNTSFSDMVACGKSARNSYCEAHNSCSPGGNAVVLYADSLVKSEKNHEMTEGEAQRRWVEFRMAQLNAEQQQALQGAALMPKATTCYTSAGFGGTVVTNCF